MIYPNKAEAIIINFIKGAVADQQLSPDEEAELQVLMDHLNVRPGWDEKTRAELIKYRLFWQIENDALPQLFVPLTLRSDESCRFLCDALRYEVTGNSEDHLTPSDALRRKLANGTYWRNAPSGTIRLADDAWRQTEAGQLYLTNRQLIFRSSDVEIMIHLDTIADFDHYRTGIFLHRSKGKPLFFAMPTGADIFAMILGRTLREM